MLPIQLPYFMIPVGWTLIQKTDENEFELRGPGYVLYMGPVEFVRECLEKHLQSEVSDEWVFAQGAVEKGRA